MTARQTAVGGKFVAVERGLWPKFDGWPFKRELEELARGARTEDAWLRKSAMPTEEACGKN